MFNVQDIGLGGWTRNPSSATPVRGIGVGVILRQLPHMMLQRIHSRRGEHTGLPHAAAQGLAPTPRLLDEIPRAQQHRSGRSAETFRQAHGYGVEAGHRGGWIDLQFHDGIENACSVQMGAQGMSVRKVRDLLQVRRLQHPSADGVFSASKRVRAKWISSGLMALAIR